MLLGVLGIFRWLLPETLRSLFLVCLGLQLFSWSTLWLPRQGIELAALLGATNSDNRKLAADFCRLAHILWLGYWILFSVHLITPTTYISPWTVTVLSWTLICGLFTLPSSWWLGRKGEPSLSS